MRNSTWVVICGLALVACSAPGQSSPQPPALAEPVAANPGNPKAIAPLGGACGAFELEQDPSLFHFVATRHYTWEPGTTIHALFLDGKAENMARVAEVAREWSKFANIDFEFHELGAEPPPGARIQISFQHSGYWSLIGSQAAHRGQGSPTMNFNFRLFSQGDGEIRRVVLHEFGHALGLWHEHQNPNKSFTWNKDAIYEYYARTNGWDKGTVDGNIFAKLDPTAVTATDFDARSIMVYSFPAEFTVERISIPYNNVLSDVDKREIAGLYPGRWTPGGGEPQPPDGGDVDTWARQIHFSFVIDSAVAASGGQSISNYSMMVDAPAAVLDQIDHVLYQRQHGTFREYANGTYYRSAGRAQSFAFAWQGWGWVAVKAKVVYKNGKVSDHLHETAPVARAKGPDWDAIRKAVGFDYLSTAAEPGGWRTYQVVLADAALAEHVHYVQYQRQHGTFQEYAQGGYINRDASGDGFALSWRGYGWVPIAIKVHFKDGSSAAYRLDAAPREVR